MSIGLASIMAILQNGLSILAYFFNPELRKKRDRKADMAKFKVLQIEYRQALAEGDPQKVSQIAKEMADLRKEYSFINKKG